MCTTLDEPPSSHDHPRRFGQIGHGGTRLLALAAGRYRALDLCLTGRQANAQDMYAWGLVNGVVPEVQHLDQAKQLALEVAKQAPVAAHFRQRGQGERPMLPMIGLTFSKQAAMSAHLYGLLYDS